MFERLTKRNSEGKATIDFKALGTPFGNDTVYDVVDLHHIACDHLAAYEDTGLEPEDIGLMLKCAAEDGETTDYQHIRDLLAAEREGRCVVLPCKVGADTYWIDPQSGKVEKSKSGAYGVVVLKDGFKILDVDGAIDDINTQYCYLTRADADAASKEATP